MSLRTILTWLVAGAAGAVLLVWAFPRAYPMLPDGWQITRDEAVATAIELSADLGEIPAEPQLIVGLRTDHALGRRLELAAEGRDTKELADSRLGRRVLAWRVILFAPGALDSDYSYRAEIGVGGELLSLVRRVRPEEKLPPIEPAAATAAADAFLRRLGIDLALYGEPEVKVVERPARRDLEIRYRDREAVLGEAFPYGIEARFAGDRLVGFTTWFEDPEQRQTVASLQSLFVLNQGWFFVPLPLSLVVGLFFLRRYHAGEVGVRRGVQLFLLVLGLGLLVLLMSQAGAASQMQTGLLSRRVLSWLFTGQFLLLMFLPLALLTALSWSVGESLGRRMWGAKLAAFDALFRSRWINATVGRSALRGVAAGAVLSGVIAALLVALRQLGAWPSAGVLLDPWWSSARWPGVAMLASGVAYVLYFENFGRLLLVSAAVRRFGRWAGGAVAAVAAGLLLWPSVLVLPVGWSVPLWLLVSGTLVVLFLRYDLLTAVVASLAVLLLPGAVMLASAADPTLRLQGGLVLLGVCLPLVLNLRELRAGEELEYQYDEVPPHVRRIAERERQKVELETARRIQSSILPELPPQLAGVRLAHAYWPATEVGGDFYDVLALEDGRLAVAVGDVAGHGVSSGLVMSMAKSALAVQVSFDPEVEAVFETLNRTVYQSARKRLLATLCYALLDPRRRRLRVASAGHLFPSRVGRDGGVKALESISYPLGVRDRLAVRVEVAELAPADSLFLFSDGLVEARPPGSDELFGFERLERSLAAHAGGSVERLRDGVLDDLQRFAGGEPMEDDLTVVVLQLP